MDAGGDARTAARGGRPDPELAAAPHVAAAGADGAADAKGDGPAPMDVDGRRAAEAAEMVRPPVAGARAPH